MSAEEIYQKLKNDPEFLHKLAEILKPEVALIVLEEVKKLFEELKKTNENLKALNDRVDSLEKRVESLENWQKKTVDELTDIKNSINDLAKKHEETNKRLERLEKQQERMIRQLKYLNNFLENIAQSIEEEARDFLAYKLKKEFNLDVEVRSLRIEKVVEIDILADLGDKAIIGEAKVRAGSKAVKQLERAIEKLLKAKPEFQQKKIIPMIYAKDYTQDLLEECKRKGIYLTSGRMDLTPLKLQ